MISFLTVAATASSQVVIDAVILGSSLAMSIYSCSKGVKQGQPRRSSRTRRK